MFEEGVEVEVMFEAKPVGGILPVRIKLVGLGDDEGLSLKNSE